MSEEYKAYREALALFPDAGPSEDRSTRYEQLEAIGPHRKRWESMDPKFEGCLYGAADYIRRHAMAFDLRPR